MALREKIYKVLAGRTRVLLLRDVKIAQEIGWKPLGDIQKVTGNLNTLVQIVTKTYWNF